MKSVDRDRDLERLYDGSVRIFFPKTSSNPVQMN